MEIIAMVDVEIPAADVGDAHVVAAQFRRLNFPNDIGTRDVLETHLHRGRCHSVNALPVRSN